MNQPAASGGKPSKEHVPECDRQAPWLPVMEQLWEDDFQTRWDASKRLLTFGDAILPDLLDLLTDPDADAELLWFLARLLGQFHRPEVAEALVHLLEGEGEDVAAAAAAALANFGPDAIPPLQNLMADSDKRLLVVRAFAYIRSSETIPPLIEVATDRDPEVRAAVIEALCSLPSQTKSLDVLVAALSDPAAKVRQMALKGLAVWMHSHPERDWMAIVSPLLGDINISVGEAAVEALGRLGNQSAISALNQLLQDPLTPLPLRLRAVRALTWIESPDAIAVLHEVLCSEYQHDSAEILACVQGLGRYEPAALLPAASQTLLEWFRSLDLSQQSAEILQAIAHSLGRLHQPDSIPSLISLLEVKDSGVRYHVIAALKHFNRAIVTHLLQQSASPTLASQPQIEGIELALSEMS